MPIDPYTIRFGLSSSSGASAAPTEKVDVETATLADSTVVAIHNVANDGEFPFMVSLQRRFEPGQRGHVCGGTLISLQHVLTAASCLYESASGTPTLINLEYYRIFGGYHNLGSNMNDPTRVRMIESFVIHPDFVGGNGHLNDIAILVLDSPFVASNRLQPIALPEQNEQPDVQATCAVPGWGKKVGTDTFMANRLKYSTQSIANNQESCIKQYTDKYNVPTVVNPNMVCASATRALTYGCPGDEGTPMVCGNSANRRLVALAFTSVRCGISTEPLLYTRVSPYADWARTVIGQSTSSSTTFQPAVAMVFILAVTQFVTSKFSL
ncbi:unnamed protein product [Chrysodeixis includens]|uniref:Peptidase S1 domain-containing protein n=1 Tax=Chrysodeixis includens TaxID=689277 RepID=A0A9N8KTI1_CHRIL|nr:unnamed protein product [Chrysodeixis includens]